MGSSRFAHAHPSRDAAFLKWQVDFSRTRELQQQAEEERDSWEQQASTFHLPPGKTGAAEAALEALSGAVASEDKAAAAAAGGGGVAASSNEQKLEELRREEALIAEERELQVRISPNFTDLT